MCRGSTSGICLTFAAQIGDNLGSKHLQLPGREGTGTLTI